MPKTFTSNLLLACGIAILFYSLSRSLSPDDQSFHLSGLIIGLMIGIPIAFTAQWRDYCKYAWSWIKNGLPKALQRKR